MAPVRRHQAQFPTGRSRRSGASDFTHSAGAQERLDLVGAEAATSQIESPGLVIICAATAIAGTPRKPSFCRLRQQRLHLASQLVVAPARGRKKGGALPGVPLLRGLIKGLDA